MPQVVVVLDLTLSRDAPPSSGLKGALTTLGPPFPPSPCQVIPKLGLYITPQCPLALVSLQLNVPSTTQPQTALGLAWWPQLPAAPLCLPRVSGPALSSPPSTCPPTSLSPSASS